MQNGTEFRAYYSRYFNDARSDFNHVDLGDIVYSEQCYDATWALAYALNDTLTECSKPGAPQNCSAGLTTTDITFGLQHFLYNNSEIHQKIKSHLEDTNFTGITVSCDVHASDMKFYRCDSHACMQGEITFNRSDGARRVGKTVVLSYKPLTECGHQNGNIINHS